MFDTNFNFANTFFPEPNLATTNPAFAGRLYGVQAIGDKLYVTYLSEALAGGILDVCDLESSTTNPTCSRLFASNLSGTEKSPVLFAPWGVALAPKNFGPLSNQLLVGNVGDGRIHAFDPNTGRLNGTLNLGNGSPVSIPDYGASSLAWAIPKTARVTICSSRPDPPPSAQRIVFRSMARACSA